METWTVLLLLAVGLHSAAAEIHSLMYFDTSSSGVPNFPEYVAVGLVDDIEMVHYDSNTKRVEPKQDWMSRITEDDPQYWQSQTGNFVGQQQWYKVNFYILMQRFNETGGVHIYQNMYGCEWDDETNNTNGFMRFGYDGKDFIVFDLKTETWIAQKQQALLTKHKWDADKAQTEYYKHYLTQICPDWLKKFLKFGSSSLLRKVSLSRPCSCLSQFLSLCLTFCPTFLIYNNNNTFYLWRLSWHSGTPYNNNKKQ